MKRFGEIRALERIVHADSLRHFHMLVDSMADLDKFPEQTVAILRNDSGSFRKGDVILKEDGGWTRLVLKRHGLDPVVRLRAMRFGNKVVLRWNDPRDRYDKDGNLLSEFYRTILVRKLGSEPENEFDGTQVYINYKRNAFRGDEGETFIDYLPTGDGIGKWFYKAFSVSKSGLVNRDTKPVEAKELTWTEIQSMIRKGQAERIFAPGDEVPIDDEHSLVCIGIDAVNAYNPALTPHTVTFMFKQATAICPFDIAKGEYRFTIDKVVLAKKTYYYRDPSGKFKTASLKVGSAIPSGVYYESQTLERGLAGSSRWATSDIRAWLNSTSEANYGATVQQLIEAVGSLPKPPLEWLGETLGEELTNIIITQKTLTGLPNVDGSVIDTVSDKFFLPSLTEYNGMRNGSYLEGKGQFEGFSSGKLFVYSSMYGSNAEMEAWARSINAPFLLRSALPGSDDDGCSLWAVDGYGNVTNIRACITPVFVPWCFSIG